jgi:hypothetical protein
MGVMLRPFIGHQSFAPAVYQLLHAMFIHLVSFVTKFSPVNHFPLRALQRYHFQTATMLSFNDWSTRNPNLVRHLIQLSTSLKSQGEGAGSVITSIFSMSRVKLHIEIFPTSF